MKKLVAVLVIALVVAATVWIVVRVQIAKRLATVPSLLPETTLILLEAPDLQKTRAEWHESDLYKIWREPAVQSFLQKPLGRLPADRGGRRTLEEFLALGPKNSFVALTSLEKNEPKLIGGFHFDVPLEKAREFIGRREAELLSKTGNARRETIVYEQHKIETVTVARFVFASVYDNQWYFASNDVALLKTLLDRVDHRSDKEKGSLEGNAAFAAAVKHLPRIHAGMVFVDPRPFVEKLLPFVAMTGQSLPMDQLQRLRQVQSVASAMGFENGKMRETDFVAMPQVSAGKKLQRPLLGAAGTNTFLYSNSRIRWSDNLLAPASPAAVGLPALVQQFITGMKARGISLEDLRPAFGRGARNCWRLAGRCALADPARDSAGERRGAREKNRGSADLGRDRRDGLDADGEKWRDLLQRAALWRIRAGSPCDCGFGEIHMRRFRFRSGGNGAGPPRSAAPGIGEERAFS